MRESPAQPAQSTACFLHASAPSAEFQNVQLSISLGEACSAARLRQAWQQAITHYGVLRSSFFKIPSGEFVYREHDGIEGSWRVLDWSKTPPDEVPRRWAVLLEEDAAQTFDLAMPPLVRFVAIELPAGHCHLLMTYPKVLLDEDTLFRVLCAWLGALEGALPVDVEEESRRFEESPVAAGWWPEWLSKAPAAQILRVYPRHALDRPSLKRNEAHLTLDRQTSEALQRLCRELVVAPRDAFLALWAFVLGRLTASDQITILATCSVPGPRNLGWGLIENLLPASISIQKELSVSQWLKAVAHEEDERRYHGAIGLAHVLHTREVAEFPMAFAWLSPALNDRIHRALPRWIRFDVKPFQRAIFPFTFEVRPEGHQFTLRVEFDPDFFPVVEATKLLERVARVASLAANDPATGVDSLTVLTAAETQMRQPAEAGPALAKTASSMWEKIASVIAKQPLALAIEGPNDTGLSFAELESCARLLAEYLRSDVPLPGGRVGICLTPTPWIPVAVFGTLLAGSSCVPLDHNSSAHWLVGRLNRYEVTAVLCDSITAPLFASSICRVIILDQKWEAITASARGEVPSAPAAETAFLLMGTEFDPPPVLRGLASQLMLDACQETLSLWTLQAGDRVPLLTTGGSAAFVEIVLSAMVAGATVVLLGAGNLSTTLRDARPSHLRLTAGQWRRWITELRGERSAFPESLRFVCIEEEIISPAIYAQWQVVNDGQARTIFFSSPAGFSGLSVRYEAVDRPGLSVSLTDVPVGVAGPGVAARLVDSAAQPLPPLYPGQLTIELLDDRTEKFVAPAWRDRLGMIHFIPSEDGLIERALAEIPGIQDAHSAMVPTRAPSRSAWLIRWDGSLELPPEVPALVARLPNDLKPEALQAVAEFPLTPGGTIHSAKLSRSSAAQATEPVETGPSVRTVNWQPLLLLHRTPDAPTLFLIHDLEGSPEKYRDLVSQLSQDWTLIGTTARGLHAPAACHPSVESEAAALVEAVRMQDPDGPYHLFGYGFGAVLAFEMAQQLRAADCRVRYLALTGSGAPTLNGKADDWMRSLSRAFSRSSKHEVIVEQPTAAAVELSHANALKEFRTRPLDGPCCVIMGTSLARDHEAAWRNCAPEATINRLDCEPDQMLKEPSVKDLAGLLRDYAKVSFN